MADIDVVPKHRSYTWLWIVLAIVAVVIIWMMMRGNSSPTNTGSVRPIDRVIPVASVAYGRLPASGFGLQA